MTDRQKHSENLDARLGDDMDKKYQVYPGDPRHTSALDLLSPFAGIQSFMRLPYSRDLQDIDIAIYGMPFGLGTTNRSGARYGPPAMRQHSLLLGTFSVLATAHT